MDHFRPNRCAQADPTVQPQGTQSTKDEAYATHTAAASLGSSAALDIQPVTLPGGSIGATVLLDDWNALFGAVKARLRTIAMAPAAWPQGGFDEQQPHPVAAMVLDCALALDSLHVQLLNGLAVRVPDARQVRLGEHTRSVPPQAAPATHAAIRPQEAHLPAGPAASRGALPRDAIQLRDGNDTAAAVAATGALPWLPGQAFLRERIAVERARALARESGFSLLRILFQDLDSACAAHEPGSSPMHAAARAREHVDVVRQGLLTAIAARLRGALRRQDVITQIGRAEFCCLLVDAHSPEGLDKYVFNVVHAVSLPFSLSGRQLRVQPVFGVASYPLHGTSADELLRFAEPALQDLSPWPDLMAAPGAESR